MIGAGKFLQKRYRIDKQIGQGGMGAVYVATDERFGSTVAIKETLFMNSNFRKAIEREARLLNSLKHTALPRVSDHFEEDDGLFLVMEFIPGEDLGFILDEQHKPFDVDQVVKWADQLLDALDYLHTQEIPVVHRDIKPQNLKVTPRGQIILLDFGLAKGNPTDAGHQTAAKSIFGYSRNYASLEQIQGTGTDPRSDLYSLGATLYHLLTGVPPEDALTRAMSVLSQKPDPLVPANAIRPEIPAGVAGVLQRALDLNAEERPASAAEMRQMFRESEKYEDFANARTVANLGTDSHVFAQQTKIMPEATRAGDAKQTDIKTEILPEYLSELTSVRQGSSTSGTALGQSVPPTTPVAVNQKRRPLAIAAGLIGLLLFGGAIAGGLYKYGPFSRSLPADEKVDHSGATAPNTNVLTDGSALTTANTNASQASEPADQGAVSSDKLRSTATEKPAETSKGNKAAATDKPRGQNETVDIQVPPDEDIPGNVIVTRRNPDGTTTTTRIMKNGQTPPNVRRAPVDPLNPYPYGVDPATLTPAQRRKLREAIRRANNMQVYPTPPKPQ